MGRPPRTVADGQSTAGVPCIVLLAVLAVLLLLPAPESPALQDDEAAQGVQTDGTSPGQGEDAATLPELSRLAGSDRIGTAIAVSQDAFVTADTVVLAGRDAVPDALVGAPLAAANDGPLLLTDQAALPQAVTDELDRLDARQVVLLGGEVAIGHAVADQLSAQGRAVSRLGGATRHETAAQVAGAIEGWDGAVVASGEAPVDAVVGAAMAAVQGRPVLLVSRDTMGDATAALLADRDVAELVIVGGPDVVSDAVADQLGDGGVRQVERIAGDDRYATSVAVHVAAVDRGLFDPATVWLAAGSEGGIADALAAGPAVAARTGSLLLIDGAHLERATASATRLRALASQLRSVVLVGGTAAISSAAPDQLAALLHGPELPGGGRSLLPDTRLVALYGSHFSPALGVLGEQPPEEVGPRIEAIVGPYVPLSDRPILPTLEVIATIATAAAGADGAYRTRSTDEELQQWLDAARAQGAYLVLDLQPGRSDFLTEAQAYEHLLREPDVGLALDPEWRVDAPETPGGGTIGHVDAAEVNAVSAWLADLVVDEQLPEKLLIVHNFRVDMIRDRDQLLDRDGMAVLLHMDGQGPRATKLESYRILRQDPPFHNGFKVFFDEDPDPFQPEEVMGLDPVPDFISYQ